MAGSELLEHKPMPEGYCTCEFKGVTEERDAIEDMLREFGDDIPETEVEKAVECMDGWVAACACEDLEKPVSAARYEHNDWYLYTIKNLMTDPEHARKGLGAWSANEASINAMHDGAVVLACDITHDNIPSKKCFEPLGFTPVGRFCWDKDEKPADIMHYILYPPEGADSNVCPAPQREG